MSNPTIIEVNMIPVDLLQFLIANDQLISLLRASERSERSEFRYQIVITKYMNQY